MELYKFFWLSFTNFIKMTSTDSSKQTREKCWSRSSPTISFPSSLMCNTGCSHGSWSCVGPNTNTLVTTTEYFHYVPNLLLQVFNYQGQCQAHHPKVSRDHYYLKRIIMRLISQEAPESHKKVKSPPWLLLSWAWGLQTEEHRSLYQNIHWLSVNSIYFCV